MLNAFCRRYPQLPATRETLVLPAAFMQTSRGSPFLRIDCPEFLVFATDANLDMAFSSTAIFMDGTFDSSPALFRQIFTIHAFFEERQVCILAKY